MAINKTMSPFDDASKSEGPARKSAGGKVLKFLGLLILLAVIVIIVGALFVGAKRMWTNDSIATVSSKDWQAIFLTNGQVYFGKVKQVGMKSVVLADIYYLQVVTKPLQSTATGAAATAAAQTQQELTLIKLGNEIHGPTDAMVINRDQVLLTEKLKADSRVVQAIASYVNDQAAAAKK